MTRSLVCLGCLAILSGVIFSQSNGTKLSFDMADVHPTDPSAPQRFSRGAYVGNDKYQFLNATLIDLISAAYGMDADKVQGGPSWLEWDHFDINARMPANTTADEQKLMLQSLLAERFKLAVHKDSKQLLAYSLSAGKTPRIRQSDGSGDSGCKS